MDFRTKYDRRDFNDDEKPDPVSKTETAGYIAPDVQIMNIIEAGRRLDDYRKEAYDIAPGSDVEDAPIDPTRSGGFDMADASQAKRDLESRADLAKKNYEISQAKKVVDNPPKEE